MGSQINFIRHGGHLKQSITMYFSCNDLFYNFPYDRFCYGHPNRQMHVQVNTLSLPRKRQKKTNTKKQKTFN